MYEPAGSAPGVYGDLRNPVQWCGRRVARDLLLAGDGEQTRRSVSALVGRCHGGRPADLALISMVVELTVDLGVRPPDGRSGTASMVDRGPSRRVTTPSSRTRAAKPAARGAAF
jgi:hypothetical protein